MQEHPSNTFFSGFSNCLVYRSPAEFSRHLDYALANDPNPVRPALRQRENVFQMAQLAALVCG